MLMRNNGGMIYLQCITFQRKNKRYLTSMKSKYAVSKLSITTPNVLERFSRLRPFNKILLGAGYKKDADGYVVIPTISYLDEKKRQYVQHLEFTDYSTGKSYPNDDLLDSSLYWKPLSLMLEDYSTHKEVKSGGDVVGLLPRLRVKIGKNLVKFVGKETANLDAANAIGMENNYTVYDNLADRIMGIRPRDSYKFGISRSNLISLQKKIRENKGMPKLHKNTLEKLKRVFSGAISENSRNDNRKDADHMITKEVIMK